MLSIHLYIHVSLARYFLALLSHYGVDAEKCDSCSIALLSTNSMICLHSRSNVEQTDVSFGSFYAGDGVAEAFGEEMLAWYEQNEQLSQSPDGPSTLV